MKTDCTGRLVTRAETTTADYFERAHSLIRMAHCECEAWVGIAGAIECFSRQNGRWAEATVRQYRAALLQELERAVQNPTERSALSVQLYSGPVAKVAGPKRTSARKRKSLPRSEFLRLTQFLRTSRNLDDRLVLGYVAFGAALFLRPSEYAYARVDHCTLIVKNAKSTNGRANGEERERDLSDLAPDTIIALQDFLGRYRTAIIEAGDQKTLHQRLASRLCRVCETLDIERVSPYTLRHVGIATVKSWMTPAEVAAAAGHAAVRTATSHYAKRRTGWFGLKLAGRPSSASVSRMRGEAKFFSGELPTNVKGNGLK